MFVVEHFIIGINTISIIDSASSFTVDESKREDRLWSRDRWWTSEFDKTEQGDAEEQSRCCGVRESEWEARSEQGGNSVVFVMVGIWRCLLMGKRQRRASLPTIAGTWTEVCSDNLLFFFLWSGNPTTRGYNWKLFTSIKIDFISILIQDRDCVHHLIKFDFFNCLFMFDWRIF